VTETVLAIGFPWGRYHATAWGRNVNEGAVDWPPEPWRLLRALYSVWCNRAPELDEEVVLRTLAKLAALPLYELPQHGMAQTRHYQPDVRHGTDKVLDAFVVVPAGAEVVVRWPVQLDADERAVLSVLADRLGYLGRAESVVDARLLDEPGIERDVRSDRTVHPVTTGDEPVVDLLAPEQPLDVEALTATTIATRKGGRIDPLGSRRVSYLLPSRAPAPEVRRRRSTPARQVTAVRYRIVADAPPPITMALAVTDRMRQAALSRHGRATGDAPCPTLTGRGPDGRPLEGNCHAHYLALTTDWRSYPRLDTIVVWATGRFGAQELGALVAVDHLRPQYRDFRPIALGVEAFGDVREVAPELCGRSRGSHAEPVGVTVWHSFTPFAPPRHPRRGRWEAMVAPEVRRELVARGIETPVEVSLLAESDAAVSIGEGRIGPVPWGWTDFQRFRRSKGQSLRDARRAFGVRLEFEEPVAPPHPICLGSFSHFGLGLFLPAAG
jgi:CRISPR-associated protein Csb2